MVEIPCLDLISISGSLPEGFTSLTNRIINLAHPNECEINIEVGDSGIFHISSSDSQALIEIFDKCLHLRVATR